MSDSASGEGKSSDAGPARDAGGPPEAPARVMLDALLSATARAAPLSPRDAALRQALRQVRGRFAGDAAMDADAVAARVAAALDRVPKPDRGTEAAWSLMTRRIADQLLADDVAKAKLEQLWSELADAGGEAA
jgi:hypothetical protein